MLRFLSWNVLQKSRKLIFGSGKTIKEINNDYFLIQKWKRTDLDRKYIAKLGGYFLVNSIASGIPSFIFFLPQ
jgi:hypothetical protein